MLLCLFLCVVMGGEVLLSAFFITANAEGADIEYTNVYNDLTSDRSFDKERYPELASGDEKYYSLELITIAESENKELFVYVYQPSADEKLHAASIDISQTVRTDKSFKNYKLEYINSHGVFFKYKVKDLTVSSEATRYYEISDILRPWSESYGDKTPGGDNTISEVSYPVGRMFTVTDKNGSTSMAAQDIEYISVTQKFVGYIRYEQDSPIFNHLDTDVDAHFVAFSTDRKIDELLEADVYYESQTYHAYKSGFVGNVGDPWGDIKEGYKYLDYEQKAECEISDGSIFTHSTYIWDRIQKTSDFLTQDVPLYIFPGFSIGTNIEFTDEAKLELAKTQWVLSFVETEHNEWYHSDPVNGGNGDFDIKYTRVGDVKILRLKFKTDGQIYDLGVVDNKQTGSKDPAAVVEEQDWWQMIMAMLMLIVLLLILSFLWAPLATILKILWNGIKFLFRLLFGILMLPFKLIGTLTGRGSKKKRKQ